MRINLIGIVSATAEERKADPESGGRVAYLLLTAHDDNSSRNRRGSVVNHARVSRDLPTGVTPGSCLTVFLDLLRWVSGQFPGMMLYNLALRGSGLGGYVKDLDKLP